MTTGQGHAKNLRLEESAYLVSAGSIFVHKGGAMDLPPFPVDDATLDMLCAAIDPWSAGDDAAERSCVGDFLTFMSQLGGSDTEAVEEDDGRVRVMRDPAYHEYDVMAALVGEIRRLRALCP